MLIGQQIGVCLHLLEIVEQVRKMQKTAEDAELLQKRIYEDFSHQLKSPVAAAKLRVEDAVRFYAGTQAPKALLVARGLVRRVHRVAANMRTLTMISKQEPLDLKPSSVDTSWLVKLLNEIASDTIFQYANGVNFALDSNSILRLSLKDYGFDRESIEHCIANILDNAFKYSRPGSAVKVYGGIDSQARFFIAVANHGIPILPDEVSKIGTRTWRSFSAKGLGLDGQGIGLWLVKELLRPQGGELVVTPHHSNSMTEFRIAFHRTTPHLKT
jgi:signal transduction histidine kinase